MYSYNLGMRFQQVAREHPRHRAIWFSESDSASYSELDALSNRIARALVECGVAEREVVCISGVKSLYTFGCMLACLKLGTIYCVLDPDSPAERLRKILSTCRPRLMLGERGFLERAGGIISELGLASAEKADVSELSKYDDADLPQLRRVTGMNPAYLMFTSGSTGFPKGAVMTHANVLNLIAWSAETFRITAQDRLTNVNPLYFDNSVFDFYTALFTGARLVPFSKDQTRDPKVLVDRVAAAGCTLWFSVPSLLIFLQTMKAADGQNLRSISRFVFGGEGYPKAKLKNLYDAYADNAELFNVYGPTECTCICSSYKITADDFRDLTGLPPLGRIADNFSYLLVGENGRAVSGGETGELCLLGPNVGLGYYNDPERTSASFVQNPENERFREIMYRTGDIARLEPADGKLYIQGRRDNQIKHMGYRIELEEIEAALNCLHYVSEAAALHTSANGLSRIIAVVASREQFEDGQIRGDLKQIIPDYMIPSVFHREQALPKNPSGKVDRGRLAEKYLRAQH